MNFGDMHFKKVFENNKMADSVSIIYKSYKHYLMHQIQDLGITTGQIPFILQLNSDENISQDEIANFLFLSRGTAAKALRKLDDLEIIERKVDMDNRRKYIVALTSKGKKIANKIKDIDENWEKLVYQELEGHDKDELSKTLKDLAIVSTKAIMKERLQNPDSFNKKIIEERLKKYGNPFFNHKRF